MGSGSTPLESLPLLQAAAESSHLSDSAQLKSQQPDALVALQQRDQLAAGVAPNAVAMQAAMHPGEISH